jgi:general secretion pathway protein B
MSYILDALRRADSERERNSIPGIHAQPVPHVSAGSKALPGPRPWVWLAVGVLVVVLGQWIWQMLREPAAPQPAAPPAFPATASPAPAAERSAEPPPNAIVMPEPALPTPPAQTAQARPPAAAPAPDAAAARRPPASTTRPQAAMQPEAASATAGGGEPVPGLPAAPAAEERIPALAELPPDIRQAVPRLQVGGSVYSDNAASRFVILNGLIFHESDRPTPELLLERIELKSAVLVFRGHRFRITF